MMNDYLLRISLIIVSYLLGAVPFGLVTARIMGAGDIRKIGSGNIGATNVLRTTGKLGGFITFLCDALKGVLPVLIAKSWWGMETWTLAVAFAAVLGHNFPVYLKFKGGKGVATSLGVLITLWPYVGLITIGIWLSSAFIWRYSSLSALISFAILPIVIYLGEGTMTYIIFSLFISVMLFYRHKENIKRLVEGNEKKIGKGGSSVKSRVIITLVLAAQFAFTTSPILAESTLPPEVQKLWDARRSALSRGDREFGEALLKQILEAKYNLGINRMDDLSALLLREGYQALGKSELEEAFRLSIIAREISPDYAPSYFLSARVHFNKSNIMPAAAEYLEGLKVSLQDFWSLFHITGRLYNVLFIALTLTSLTFIVVWILRQFTTFIHLFKEITSGYIDRPLRPIFVGIIMILPLLFGIGWFVLFWIVGVWIYLSRKERVIAIFIMAFFLFLPEGLKYSSIFTTGGNNIILQGLLAVEKGYGSPELKERLKNQYHKESWNKYIPLSIAYLSYKEGNAKESSYYYHMLLEEDQKNIRIWALNNLGNLYYKMGQYDDAIKYYKRAISESPESAIPAYNLSQAYREKLMFAEAETAYGTAKSISPADVGRYSSLTIRGKGYRVIDFPINNSDPWTAALRPTEESDRLAAGILRGIFKIPHSRLPFLGVSIFLILTLLSYLKPRTPIPYSCPKCGQTVCGWCIGSRIFGNLCKECRGKNEQVKEVKEMDRRISFLLPGIWHIYKGRVFSGGLINFIFFSGVAGLILGEIDDTWNMAYYLSGKLYISWMLLVFFSYLLITFHLKFIKLRLHT